MTTLIGLSCRNIFAGKLNFQDCFRYDFMFINSEKTYKTKEEQKQLQHTHGQSYNCHFDEIDQLDDSDELDEIDYMLY